MTEAMKYEPDYDTDHIRTSLKPQEYHPSEAFALGIINAYPRAYVEYMTEQLAESLKKEENKDHPMGATWATLVKILNGEEVHGRYLMGAALYLANTTFNVAGTIQQALAAMAEQQQEIVDDTVDQE